MNNVRVFENGPVMNASEVAEILNAAAITRSFTVGFRFYRQRATSRKVLLVNMHQTLCLLLNNASNSTCMPAFAEPQDVREAVFNVADNYGKSNEWAYSVLALAAPFLVSGDGAARAINEAKVVEILSAAGSQGNPELLSAAYQGNRAFSRALSIHFQDVPVFNEDDYPGANTEVPEVPGIASDWLQALKQRRAAQRQRLDQVSVAAPSRPAVAEAPRPSAATVVQRALGYSEDEGDM